MKIKFKALLLASGIIPILLIMFFAVKLWQNLAPNLITFMSPFVIGVIILLYFVIKRELENEKK